MNRSQRKFKKAKRTHHQKMTKKQNVVTFGIDVGRDPATSVLDFIEKELDTKLLPYQAEIVEKILNEEKFSPPTRAKCPECGFSHKVRKDGTMSRHDVYLGSDPTECAGTGKYYSVSATN